MEINGSNSQLFENKSSTRRLETVEQEQKPAIHDDDSITLFINYAAIAWLEMRRAWRADQSHASQKIYMEPVISWSTKLEELLLSKKPFDKPVPLSEMVQFLVETWEEEGLLYDLRNTNSYEG